MSGWTGRTRMLAVLAVGAIAAAGCGGSSTNSSASSAPTVPGGSATAGSATTAGSAQANQELAAAAAQIKVAQQGVKANPNDPNAWSQLAVASSNGADKLNAVTLPASVTSAKQRYAASIKKLGDDAAKIAQALKNKDAAGAQADKVQYLKDALASAGAAVTLAQRAKAAGVQ